MGLLQKILQHPQGQKLRKKNQLRSTMILCYVANVFVHAEKSRGVHAVKADAA